MFHGLRVGFELKDSVAIRRVRVDTQVGGLVLMGFICPVSWWAAALCCTDRRPIARAIRARRPIEFTCVALRFHRVISQHRKWCTVPANELLLSRQQAPLVTEGRFWTGRRECSDSADSPRTPSARCPVWGTDTADWVLLHIYPQAPFFVTYRHRKSRQRIASYLSTKVSWVWSDAYDLSRAQNNEWWLYGAYITLGSQMMESEKKLCVYS